MLRDQSAEVTRDREALSAVRKRLEADQKSLNAERMELSGLQERIKQERIQLNASHDSRTRELASDAAARLKQTDSQFAMRESAFQSACDARDAAVRARELKLVERETQFKINCKLFLTKSKEKEDELRQFKAALLAQQQQITATANAAAAINSTGSAASAAPHAHAHGQIQHIPSLPQSTPVKSNTTEAAAFDLLSPIAGTGTGATATTSGGVAVLRSASKPKGATSALAERALQLEADALNASQQNIQSQSYKLQYEWTDRMD